MVSYKIIEGKKYLWDGKIYETESEAEEVRNKYQNDNFEVRVVSDQGKYYVYNRRVVEASGTG